MAGGRVGHKCNETYFEKLNSNSAYFLGFITGDGNISINDSNNYYFQMNLHIKDRCIIDNLIKELEWPLKPTEFIQTQVSGLITPKISIKITNKKLCSDLISYGIVPRKTGKETLPTLDESVKYDYLRGFFDADGSIKKSESITFTSQSVSFLEDLNHKLMFDYGNIYAGKGCSSLEIGKKQYVLNIGKLMYKDGKGIWLQRKKERFDKIVKPKYFTAFGETKTLPEWFRDKRVKCRREELQERIKYSSLSFEEMINIPTTKSSDVNSEVVNIEDWVFRIEEIPAYKMK